MTTPRAAGAAATILAGALMGSVCGRGSSPPLAGAPTTVPTPQPTPTPPTSNTFTLVSINPAPGSIVRTGDTVLITWSYCQLDPSWGAGMALVRDDGRTLLQTVRLSGGPACHGPTGDRIIVSSANILGFAQGHTLNGRFVMGRPPLTNEFDGGLLPARVEFSVEVPLGYRFE